MTADAYHITSPHPHLGASKSMQLALEEAGEA
jgi:3-oxoacyl-(acyl-carrier-protein) synthase